jgi:hypothetical protein
LKRKRFATVEEVKTASQEALNNIKLQHSGDASQSGEYIGQVYCLQWRLGCLDLITCTDHPQRCLMVARIQVMMVFDLPRCVKSVLNMVLGD